MKLYKLTNKQKEEVKVKAYLVYDKATGKIVHRHWYQENEKVPVDKERILKLVTSSLKTSSLEIIAIDPNQMHPGKKYHINTANNLLEEL